MIVDSGMSYQIVHLQILLNGKYLCKCTSDTHSKTKFRRRTCCGRCRRCLPEDHHRIVLHFHYAVHPIALARGLLFACCAGFSLGMTCRAVPQKSTFSAVFLCDCIYGPLCMRWYVYVTNYSSTPSVFKNGVTRWWLMAMEFAHWQHCTRSVHVENLWIASNMRLLPCGLLSELLTSRLMQLFAMRACRCRSSSRGMCAYMKK